LEVSCDTIRILGKEMMKKIAYIIAYCFFVTTFVSCSKHYKLKKNDRKYIPYKGNEVLVFHSNKNRMDTIFLKGLSNFNGCGDPLDLFPDKCDGISLNCTRTDPNYDRYLEGKGLVELVATSSGKTRISFDIVLRASWFYNMDSYSLSEFDKMPNSELTIEDNVYKDVKIFEASDYAKQYQQRDNYAERFYWSLSQGFLGLDRRDEKWRMIKKYEP
jgi:hypothetical protein